ncbi:MAG: YgiT-type zinc finger protein [Candidatus Hatepunaea meridiana]|nr:YgiT-type zinc finger protein [Candidatus Hatepunaea meridiana]
MSSSHQNGISDKFGRIELPVDFPCPECGRPTLSRIVEDFKLLDGRIVPNLERTHCSSCKEEFFDIEAMRKIEAVRFSKRDVRRAATKRKMEPENA